MTAQQAYEECTRLFAECCRLASLITQTREPSEAGILIQNYRTVRQKHSGMAAQMRLLIECEAATLN